MEAEDVGEGRVGGKKNLKKMKVKKKKDQNIFIPLSLKIFSPPGKEDKMDLGRTFIRTKS